MRKAKVFFRIREIRNIREADEWKNIEKEAKADIINLSDTKEVADVHIVGKIVGRFISSSVSSRIRILYFKIKRIQRLFVRNLRLMISI